MEALVVVAIIAISAAIAAPAMTEALADRETNEAANQLVRIGVRAQTEAMAYGRAHVLRYDTSSPNGNVDVWRGRSSLCTTNNWNAIITGTCAGNPDCVDQLDMASYAFGSHQSQLRLPGATTANLCFQPDGELMVSVAGGVFAPTPPTGTGAVTFTVTRMLDGSPTGVARTVIFPLGGTPRIVR